VSVLSGMKALAVLACLSAMAVVAPAQKLDPVTWKFEFTPDKAPPGATATGKLTATLEPGWHLYSPTSPMIGPPTTITVADNDAIEKVELLEPKPERKFDPNFNLETETYEHEAVFYLLVTTKKNAPARPIELTAKMRYRTCNDTTCLPPRNKQAAATLTLDSGAPAVSFNAPPGYMPVKPRAAAASAKAATTTTAGAPVTPASEGMAKFLLVAFGLGLAAVFTPCVFPMIPITMSYFLNRQGATRADSVVQASTFCGGIVVLFTALGFFTTALLGPFGVVQVGSNPWVNGFITVVFLIFAFSLLGAFEITLPSGLLTKLDQASQKGGIVGTLLMGLTFALTSFACVGPFMGSLLAASVQGDKLQPALGMLAFSGGLASPFFFLALFPSQMGKLPKSGGWLPRVKIVLGFVLLAGSLKYLSNIDQVLQWNVLTRERFLAAWIVLFALPGLYLFGLLRMEGIKPEEKVGVGRALVGAAFVIFAVSLVPGMFCGHLGELDAYVPISTGCAASASGGGEEGRLVWMKNQYKEALAKAKQENKLVFVYFTGYACTNCHWMKANMFPRPEIIAALKDYVLVELYTDGTDDASRINQELQEKKFATVAIPYYALMDADEKVIATFPGLTKKPQEFLAFLQSGTPAKSASL
jgi:thiol:disulfide interchange protein